MAQVVTAGRRGIVNSPNQAHALYVMSPIIRAVIMTNPEFVFKNRGGTALMFGRWNTRRQTENLQGILPNRNMAREALLPGTPRQPCRFSGEIE
ncbi:MAG: hypothetical protein JO076_11675 [Verrucomicrobia bacterium]|nr:hypothetical protein [Verrucomicrobiota bacterium]